MKIRFATRAAAWLMASALIVEGFVMPAGVGAAPSTGQTAPGTNITNNATATYQDASGNTYNTTSNTVTTVVQNAPTIAETAGTGTAYSPGQVVTDSFTVTNQGNAGGFFQVSGNGYAVNASTGVFTTKTDATIAGTDSSYGTLGGGGAASVCGTAASSNYAVSIGGAAAVNCATLTDLNTYLAGKTIPAYSNAAADTIVVSVYYTISNTATTTGSPTITSTLNANIQYASVTGAAQEVSAVATGTESNTVVADAILNQYKASLQCTVSPCTPTTDVKGDVAYTVSTTNGGAKDAKDLTSVKTLLAGAFPSGGGTGGVLLSDKVPQFGGSPLALSNISASNYQVSITTNTTNGFAAGAKAYLVYSTSATAASWAVASGGPATGSGTTAFTIPTSAGAIYYVGVVIVNGTCAASGYEICSYTANTTTNGNANVASHPAVQYSFTVAQPTGPGSANAGTMLNVGDAAWGDNQPTEHVLGPGIAANTSDASCVGTCLNATNKGINYTSATLTPGASNQTSDKALAAYAALTGPYDASEATTCTNNTTASNCLGADAEGSYDGVVTTSQNADFTAIPFGAADQIVNTGTVAGTPATSVTTGTGSTLCVEHTLYNSGNKDDAYNISIGAQPTAYAVPTTSGGTASTGWTFGVYSNSTCTTALGGSLQAATTTASNVSVTSGSPLTYFVKYVVPSGLKYFTRFDSAITATSVGDGTQTNSTHDELYSSFVALTKTENSAATNCPSNALGVLPSSSATQICPGGTISYTIDYRNLVLGTASTNVSFAQCYTKLGQLAITDDGTQATTSSATLPNWATFTTGLQSALTSADKDSAGNVRSGANADVYTYWDTIPTGTGSATFTAPGTKFADQVGNTGFQLVPKGALTLPVSEPAAMDWQGTISFTLTVK